MLVSPIDKPKQESKALLFIGIALVIIGIIINWKASKRLGIDFAYIYAIGKSLLTGQNVYDRNWQQYAFPNQFHSFPPNGVFYPPSTGFIGLPFSVLAYVAGQKLWFLVMMAVMLIGVWSFLNCFAQKLTVAQRTVILGAICCSSCMRWGFYALQAAPMLVGLLGLFLVGIKKKNAVMLYAIAGVVICLKFTVSLPFLGLAFLDRRYKLIGFTVILCILLNVLGFVRMGGTQAVTSYRSNMQRLDTPHTVDYPSPWDSTTIERTDWPYLLNGLNENLPRSRAISAFLSIVSLGWLAREWWRSRGLPRDVSLMAVFLGPLMCLDLLSVYHHHYDTALLLIPVMLYLLTSELKYLPGVRTFTIPLLLFLAFYAVSQFEALVSRFAGHETALALKMIGGTLVTIAFAASLIILKRYLDDKLISPIYDTAVVHEIGRPVQSSRNI